MHAIAIKNLSDHLNMTVPQGVIGKTVLKKTSLV